MTPARLLGCHLTAVVFATSVGCVSTPRRQQRARAPIASSVALRSLEANGTGPKLRSPCPVDLSARELHCSTAQPAVVEVVFSADGRVASSRISRSSGIQALDIGCMLATNSCAVGQSSQQATVECSLQCE
jgi:hypothetical protein